MSNRTLSPREICSFIRTLYPGENMVALHRPIFRGREKELLAACIDSTFVSSVGEHVDGFESDLIRYTGSPHAIVTVSGTAALHAALHLGGVGPGDLVLTQALTFVATGNAILYTGAKPVFVDVEEQSLGMSPDSLRNYLKSETQRGARGCEDAKTGQRVAGCIPMHTFGHPCRIGEIAVICEEFGIPLFEDAAESLGSFQDGHHTGLTGDFGVLSFNGNKIVTSGGGGAILAKDPNKARRAKHLITTAKIPHAWQFRHDEMGFNYRMPNLNAALARAQLEMLPEFLEKKRKIASEYRHFFAGSAHRFVEEPPGCRSNFWLNSVLMPDRRSRDVLLEHSNASGIMTRTAWELLNDLPMFQECRVFENAVAREIQGRLINLPSSVPVEE